MSEIIENKISYSEFKIWNECTHKHKLVYIDKIPHFSSNEYTAFGTAIHKVCEEKIQDPSVDAPGLFQETFLDQLKEVKESGEKLNTTLVTQMREQASPICDQFLSSVMRHFGKYSIFSVEEEILEPITDFNAFGKKFKGYIDLVIRTPDDKYHIIDWKTCSWGWNMSKKTDKILNYQLVLYKHFFAKKHDIDPSDIKTYFGLLKRTAKKDNVEIYQVSSGEKKTNNCLSLLERSVININRKVSIKNRLSCKYCKFYKTENCK